MVYGKLAAVIKFMVVVPCGMGTGFVFYLIPTSHARNIWCVFGMILGTVLAHGMIEHCTKWISRIFQKGTAACGGGPCYRMRTDLPEGSSEF